MKASGESDAFILVASWTLGGGGMKQGPRCYPSDRVRRF